MKKYIVIILCILVSCNKHESKTQNSDCHNDSVMNNSIMLKNIDGYIGKWCYEIWMNDSAYENKSFLLELRKIGKDSIEGLFSSVWANGTRLDGKNADEDIETNVYGRFVRDSLYVNVKGSYDESSSAKAVLHIENDSSILWKTIYKDGEMYIPENVILKKRSDD